MKHIPQRKDGMALVAAIGMLVIFAMLGTAYVGYMSIEFESAGTQLHQARARNLAAGGVYAAIGDIQAALGAGESPEASYDVGLSTYRREQGGDGAYPQSVAVKVEDESGRINLNVAPKALLGAVGLDADAVQKLSELKASGRRLPSVDALLADEIVDAQTFNGLSRDLLTVYTDWGVNLNSAPVGVLAAVFGISESEAESLAGKRPFANWADVLQKVGREPETFNLDIAPFALREQPRGVSFGSRCYRLRSTVTMNMPGGDHRPVYAGAEAVVTFKADGSYSIRYWRELSVADARESETVAGPDNEGN